MNDPVTNITLTLRTGKKLELTWAEYFELERMLQRSEDAGPRQRLSLDPVPAFVVTDRDRSS